MYYERVGEAQETRKGEVRPRRPPCLMMQAMAIDRLLHQVLLAAVDAIRESTAPSAEPTEIEVLTDARTYRFRAESVADRDDCAYPSFAALGTCSRCAAWLESRLESVVWLTRDRGAAECS